MNFNSKKKSHLSFFHNWNHCQYYCCYYYYFQSGLADLLAVAVLGPSRAAKPTSFVPSPQFRCHPWFFLAKITQISDFCVSKLYKIGQFAPSIERPKTKVLQLFPPPEQRLCSWTPLGALPQIPVIGSCYRARHGAVPPRCCGLEPPLPTCLLAYFFTVSPGYTASQCWKIWILLQQKFLQSG